MSARGFLLLACGAFWATCGLALTGHAVAAVIAVCVCAALTLIGVHKGAGAAGPGEP